MKHLAVFLLFITTVAYAGNLEENHFNLNLSFGLGRNNLDKSFGFSYLNYGRSDFDIWQPNPLDTYSPLLCELSRDEMINDLRRSEAKKFRGREFRATSTSGSTAIKRGKKLTLVGLGIMLIFPPAILVSGLVADPKSGNDKVSLDKGLVRGLFIGCATLGGVITLVGAVVWGLGAAVKEKTKDKSHALNKIMSENAANIACACNPRNSMADIAFSMPLTRIRF